MVRYAFKAMPHSRGTSGELSLSSRVPSIHSEINTFDPLNEVTVKSNYDDNDDFYDDDDDDDDDDNGGTDCSDENNNNDDDSDDDVMKMKQS